MSSMSASRAAPAHPKWLDDLGHDANVFSLCFFLGLFVLIAFYPSLFNDFARYDDQEYVTANTVVQKGLSLGGLRWAFTSTVAGNWHPLTLISHMLDCELFGLKPWGHHLVSLLFHAANTMLVFIVLRALTGATGRSLVVAMLFGLHPLRVESVAWVAERKDVLSGFFWLLTIWAYAGYVRELKVKGLRFKVWYGRALLFFVLGPLSKPMVVTLPFVLLLLDFWPLGRSAECGARNAELGGEPMANISDASVWGRLVLEKIPFFALAAVSCVVTYLVQEKAGAITYEQPFLFRAGNGLISYWRYVGKTFWPADLAVIYPYPDRLPVAALWLAGVALILISVFVFRMRGERPYLLVGWFWFIGTLVPVIGLVQAGEQAMADRYTYIPSIGLLVAVVWGLCECTRFWNGQAGATVIVGGVVAVLCIGATHRQLGYWKNYEILFRHTLAITRNNKVAHNNLSAALYEAGRFDEAIAEVKEAIRIDPLCATAHDNLGVGWHRTGHLDAAVAEFRAAIKISPKVAAFHNDLGNAFKDLARIDDAISEYQAAVRLEPGSAEFHCNLGNTWFIEGQLESAIAEYQQTLRIDPGYERARTALAEALAQKQGKPPKAF